MSEKIYDAYHQEIELTNEQKACLKYSGEKTLMVKGYAGAGKSVVLMAIAQKYLEKYGHTQKNKVAIFSYQNTLVATIKEFLKVNDSDEEGIVVSTVNSYIKSIYDELARNGKAPRYRYPDDDRDPRRKKNVEMALNKHKAKYGPHRFHDLPYEFWLDEFDWMKDMNIGRDDLDFYLMYKRKGRGNKYRFSASDYATAFQIYTYYLAQQENTRFGDWADQPMFLCRNMQLIPDSFKFEHILIDEAQDLSLAQMIALKCLGQKGGDMIIAMDVNQKIHGKYWTPKLIGIDATTKKLTKSMRTTVQIDSLAESVRSKNDSILDEDDKNQRAIPEKTGPIPQLVHLDSLAEERRYLIEFIKTYLASNPKITIGVIAAKNDQLTMYSEWLTSANIMHMVVAKGATFSMAEPGVKVVSAYGAKGLEFNVVIIPMFIEGNFPYKHFPDDKEEYDQYMIKMRNLVYVSMTRAKNMLLITWNGTGGSRFIAEMDPKLYETGGSSFSIRSYSFEMDTKKGRGSITQGNGGGLTGGNAIGVSPKPLVVNNPTGPDQLALSGFLEKNGVGIADKRPRGGCLWAIGGKEISPILNETKRIYGALWTYCEKGGYATGYRSAWFTKSQK